MLPLKPFLSRALALLLLPLGVASAIPLAIGNTWVYERGISGKLDTLVALDTSRCDSGRLWKLLWNRDTARILERANGRQSWVGGRSGVIPNMEIEPESVSVRDLPYRHPSIGIDGLTISYWSLATYDYLERVSESPWPRIRFSDSLGVVWVEGGCSTCKEPESRTLKSFNGKDVGPFPVADVMDSLPMGAARLWRNLEVNSSTDGGSKVTKTSTQSVYGWTVVSKLPDSSGWMRRRILQTEQISATTSKREVDWRWNLHGGDIVGDTSWWALLAARGAAPKVVDSVVEFGRILRWRWSSYSVYPYIDSTNIQAKAGIGLHKAVVVKDNVVTNTTNTITLLWSQDSGCPCEVGVQPRRQIPSIAPANLTALLRSHPDA